MLYWSFGEQIWGGNCDGEVGEIIKKERGGGQQGEMGKVHSFPHTNLPIKPQISSFGTPWVPAIANGN